MNNCVLIAEIIQTPELRYTSDNQTPITEMLVQFPGSRPEDPPSTLKVVGWGNLAQEIQANYHQGNLVVLEGRLSMNTIDRPEGFKEKRAEMTIHRLYQVKASTPTPAPVAAPVAATAPATAPATVAKAKTRKTSTSKAPAATPVEADSIPY